MQYSLPLICAVITFSFVQHATAGAEKLKYKFRPNQTFVYDVEINWTSSSGVSHRYVGQPLIVVKNVRKKLDARLLVMGRLRYQSATGEDGQWQPTPSKDWWLGPVAKVAQQHGEISKGRTAKDDHGRSHDLCPEGVDALVSSLIFPRLPDTKREEDYSFSDELTSQKDGYRRWRKYLDLEPRFHGRRNPDGTSTRKTVAKLVDGKDRVAIFKLGTFEQFNSVKTKLEVGLTFDNSRGISVTGASVVEREDPSAAKKAGRKTVVKTKVNLIQAKDQVKKATELAMSDFLQLPKELTPHIFIRKEIKMPHLPDRYRMNALPKPGTIVGYYSDGFYYAARYLQPIDERRVQVELLGTGEKLELRAGQMANREKPNSTKHVNTRQSRSKSPR